MTMATDTSSSSAPDPPQDAHKSSSLSSLANPPRDQQSSMDPTEYPIPSSEASFVSMAPTIQEDHEALLIKLPPPKAVDSNSSVNLSKYRRRESIDPPEVLQPIDEFQESTPSVGTLPAAPATIIPGDETIEQLSAALALVPYDDGPEDSRLGETTLDTRELYSDSPFPPPTIASSSDNSPRHTTHDHHASSRELVAYELNNQLVPVKSTATPSYPMRRGFDHCFISVPIRERLSALFATLRRNAERKVIVVFATWESAKFHSLLFRQLELFTVYEVHEHMEHVDVVDTYDRFAYAYPGVLMASDIALREFDVPPNVDYVLQYEMPEDPTEYIYRFSSASLFETSCHKALLFLCPEGKEMNFITHFQKARVELSELQARKVSQFQPRVEKMIRKHAELNEAAWRAYRATVVAYESHPHKDVYDNLELDEESVIKSFAMPEFPVYVSSSSKERSKKREKKEEQGNPHASWKKEKENPHASWRKEKTWKSGEKKSWMEKEKSWKHSHSSRGLNDAAAGKS